MSDGIQIFMSNNSSSRTTTRNRFPYYFLLLPIAATLLLVIFLTSSSKEAGKQFQLNDQLLAWNVILEKNTSSNEIAFTETRVQTASTQHRKSSSFTSPVKSTASSSVSSFTSGSASNVASSSALTLETSTQEQISAPSLPPNINWKKFIEYSLENPIRPYRPNGNDMQKSALKLCGPEVVKRLKEKTLKEEDLKFCKWATSPQGGNVVVGKSWGNLKTSDSRKRFDALNCNSVITSGINPTCDDAWGDESVSNWMHYSRSINFTCAKGKPSSVKCFSNDNKDKFCIVNNARIDFSKMSVTENSASVINRSKRKFDRTFLTVDCAEQGDRDKEQAEFTFPHLFSTSLPAGAQCDSSIMGTVMMYSHDNIRNICHTMQDLMSVLLILWLDRAAGHSKDITFLNVDSLRLYNNNNDEINDFFEPYKRMFPPLLKGISFGSKTLCIQRLLIQPIPPRGFVWEGWESDSPCSFIGPSSLFQRWNVHMRSLFHLLDEPIVTPFKVVLLVRSERSNPWGSARTSRLMLNAPQVQAAIEEAIAAVKQQAGNELVFEVRDFGKMKFVDQIKLMSETSVFIGIHGAGISMSMFMSIGTPNCCGVLEIFPAGEFTPARGHGNMIRKMGIRYSRIDIDPANSHADGAVVPPAKVSKQLGELLQQMRDNSSCVLPQVLQDPYLEKWGS